MSFSFRDMLRLHLQSLDGLDWALLALLAAELIAIVGGTIAFAQRRTDPLAPRRWSRIAIALGLVSVVLAVASLAASHARLHRIVVDQGANVTLSDASLQAVDGFVALMVGLLIGAVGLAGGWALEWFVEGREPDSR